MRMRGKEYEYRKALKSAGYHGVFVRLLQIEPKDNRPSYIYLISKFWKGGYRIEIDITCHSEERAYEEIKDGLCQIFGFSCTEIVKNISAEENIAELLMNYLISSTSFNDVQLKGKYVQYVYAYLNGIKYSVDTHIHTENDRSLEYDEDHDEMLEYCRNDLSNLLLGKGMHDFQINLASDFLSVNVSIPYNYKRHHLDIQLFYQYNFDDWKQDVVDIVLCYHNMLCNFGDWYVRKYEEYLQEFGFYEMDVCSTGADDAEVITYCGGEKYGVKISVENEAIPFDNMEGHAFEQFCAEVLALNGFERINVTQGSGNQGVDIIAYKDDVKYGIQCKCYSSDIGNRAVQEVFAGKAYYQCHVGVVLTNRHFTKSAIELANRNGIILWNRDKLLQMVKNKRE